MISGPGMLVCRIPDALGLVVRKTKLVHDRSEARIHCIRNVSEGVWVTVGLMYEPSLAGEGVGRGVQNGSE